MSDTTRPARRLEILDLLRGAALIAMAIYHFAWDLEFFGNSLEGTTAVGGWKLFARSIASTFLVLVGIGLYLAHRNGVRWPAFGRRLAMIVAAALVITVATYIATPDIFIFFGILHQIAFASVAGLLFLRLPSVVTLLLAAAVIAAPYWLTSSAFDAAWWWWTGLSEARPRSSDYVPVFPWFGAVLTGIGLAGLAQRAGIFDRLAPLQTGSWSRPLLFAGRHSLAFYLIHQPVLIGCLWLVSQVWPATPATPQARFIPSCERTCAQERDSSFCSAYCGCMLDAIEAQGMLAEFFAAEQDELFRGKVRELAGQCTATAESGAPDATGETQ